MGWSSAGEIVVTTCIVVCVVCGAALVVHYTLRTLGWV
jgi:hypothetical protein